MAVANIEIAMTWGASSLARISAYINEKAV